MQLGICRRLFGETGWNCIVEKGQFSYTMGEGDEQASFGSSVFMLAHIRGCLAARLPGLVDRHEAREFLPAFNSRVLDDRVLVFGNVGIALYGLLSETAANLGTPFCQYLCVRGCTVA